VLYEYRHYQAVPGKMPALHRRFAEITTRIWEKHGIKPVGFFEAVVGSSNELHYILQWDDMAERERKWDAFQKDPLVARATNYFWRPTHYSPLQ
jgi:hypothetical protein